MYGNRPESVHRSHSRRVVHAAAGQSTLVGTSDTFISRTSGRADYISGHQRGRLGRVATSSEMFGLDEARLRAQFAPYVERFLT